MAQIPVSDGLQREIDEARANVAVRSEDPARHGALGDKYASVGDVAAAIQEYKVAAQLHADPATWLKLVELYANAARLPLMARDYLQAAAAAAPSDPRVVRWQAWFAYHLDKDKRAALELLDKLRMEHASDVACDVMLAEIDLEEGRLNEAATALQEALSKEPGNVEVNLLVARLRLKTGDLEDAFKRMVGLARVAPNDCRVPALLLACGAGSADRLRRTVEILMVLTERNPRSSVHLLSFGKALLMESSKGGDGADGRLDEAIDALTQARDLDPSHVQVSIEIGRAYLKKGDLDEADKYFTQAVKEHPDTSSALYLSALVAYRKKDWNRAEAGLQSVLEKDQSRADAHYLLGRVYLEGFRDQRRAEDKWRAALAVDPKYVWAINSLAILHYRQGKKSVAQSEIADARKLLPNDPTLLKTEKEVAA
jgi:tetratricopeptide (TPR) repeat protein